MMAFMPLMCSGTVAAAMVCIEMCAYVYVVLCVLSVLNLAYQIFNSKLQEQLSKLYPGTSSSSTERVFLKSHGGKLDAQAASLHTVAAFLTLFTTMINYTPKSMRFNEIERKPCIGNESS